jgi:hypothetical protein
VQKLASTLRAETDHGSTTSQWSVRKTREISADSPCPCDSGAAYGECCKTQAFKWVRDSRGRVYQELPLGKDAIDAMKEYVDIMNADFRQAYGRLPRKGERLDAGSHFEREDAFIEDVAEAMESADANPAWIYAFRKTGLLVTEMNERLIPRADLMKWHSAISEYRSGSAARRRQAVFDRALEQLFAEYLKYPYILGKFVGEAAKSRAAKSDASSFQAAYLLFCATKAP